MTWSSYRTHCIKLQVSGQNKTQDNSTLRTDTNYIQQRLFFQNSNVALHSVILLFEALQLSRIFQDRSCLTLKETCRCFASQCKWDKNMCFMTDAALKAANCFPFSFCLESCAPPAPTLAAPGKLAAPLDYTAWKKGCHRCCWAAQPQQMCISKNQLWITLHLGRP